MGLFFLLWPLAALASFTAVTQEVQDASNSYHIAGPDGKIDRIVLTFDVAVTNASLYATDFEVVGYQISGATMSGTSSVAVTLTLVNGDVQDTGATPLVRFFPGRLTYITSGLVGGQSVTATDGCPPVWDISSMTTAMLAPSLDGSYNPHNGPGQQGDLFFSFSEKVNLTSAPPFAMDYNNGGRVSCPESISWTFVDGSLSTASHLRGPATCDAAYGDTFDIQLLTDDNINNWGAQVKDSAGQPLFVRTTSTGTNMAAPFYSGTTSFFFMGLGTALNDTAINTYITTSTYCSRTSGFTCTSQPSLSPPAVTASSWDLDGNGMIDTIQVLTKQYAIEMTDKYSIGNSTHHFTFKREARTLADTLVTSTQSLWSLPGFNITAKREERGRVILTVAETTVNTMPIPSNLTYNGALTSWTGNALGATNIVVADRVCPVITAVKGTGGTPYVYVYFSEPVSSSITSAMFVGAFSVYYSATPFLNGTLNGTSVFIGTLNFELNPVHFSTYPVNISGLPTITHATGGICSLRRASVTMTKSDTTPPNITKVTTRDSNGNGRIDGISVKFSKRVFDDSVFVTQFKFGNFTGLTIVNSSLNDDTVEFSVNEPAGVDTVSTPMFSAFAGNLTDMSGNFLLAQNLTSTDGIGPVPLSARTGTDLPNFDMNKIVITFSEPVFNGSASDFAIISPSLTIVNYSASGAIVTLYVTATPLPDSNVTIRFTKNNNLQDAVGNLVSNFTIVAVDGVPPICGSIGIRNAITEDTNSNGRIDRITLCCGELVTGGNASSYLVANYTVIGISVNTSACPSGYSNCLFIHVQEKAYYDTDAIPAVAYTANPPVMDVVGNALSNTTFTLIDATPPVLTRILTQDTNADGKIDTFRLEFSERMGNAVGLGSYWSIPGYSTPKFVASTNQVYLELNANATGGGFDGGATPNVTVSAGGARDMASNTLAAYTNFPSVDGVFPIVLSASTAGSCKLSSVQISMNENINLSSVNVSSFQIPGYNITNVTLGGVAPYGFSLLVAPYPVLTPDVITPNVSYNTPLSIVDNGGNAMVSFTKTAIDSLAPCMVQCSGHVGGSYIAITFSEPVSTGVSNSSLNLTNFQLNNSSVSTSSILMNSSSSYQITVNASFVESDINFNIADTFASIKPLSVHDTNNNNATASCYVFNDDTTAPRLLSAVTSNSDTDAMIDRIVLTFDDQVKDSTFNITHWNVSNYDIANFSTGTTANDNILYLNLVIKTVPDTGATPTVTYTKPPFGGASDRNRNLLNTTSMTAVDGAVPMLVSFSATILSVARGGNVANATFSEPVMASNGSALLNFGNFNYKSINGGASSIQSFLDTDASLDQTVSMRLDTLALSDFSNDSVVVTVWDRANLSSTNRSVFVTKGDNTPPSLVQAKTGDANEDGKIDHLSIIFDDSVLATSFNISTFALASYSLSSLAVNDTVVDLVVNGSGQLDGNATPAFTYTAGITADLNGNFLQNFNVSVSDGVKPFLVDCSSTVPNLRDIECQFSESVTAVSSDFVLGGPLSNATVTGPTVAANGQVITIRLSRVLVLSDFKTNGTIDLANGTLVDGANNLGIPRAVRLRNTDVTPPNLTNAFTRDLDCDGFIDAIELIFNEGVISTSVKATDFTVGGGFVFTGVVSTTTDANIVRLVVTESTTPNTDAGNFPLTYTPGNLTDLSENPAGAFSLTVRDGAGVALLSVVGTVDQSVVNVTFSGAIADANISGFRLLNFSSQIAAMIDSNGADSSVAFQMTSVLSPLDFIKPAQIDPLVVDPDGNTACRIVPLTNPDKSLPTVGSIMTLDENGDGYLDGFLFNCSKPIYEASLNVADFSVANYTVTNVTALQPLNLFKLSIVQKNDTLDASVTPQVSYTKGSLTDRYGNALASFSNMQSMDGAGPAIVSAIGFGASLTITFSKPIYNSSNISTFKLTDVVYHASGNASTANALSQITDKNGADNTLSFSMSHEFTTAEYAADTISAVSASIRDVHGNQASSAQVKIRARGVVLEPEEVSGLTETQIILIAAVGGGGLLLLLIAVIAVVFLKKNGGCCKKKKDVAFDQNQIANEFDFGSAGSTEMTQSSKGAQRLEA